MKVLVAGKGVDSLMGEAVYARDGQDYEAISYTS